MHKKSPFSSKPPPARPAPHATCHIATPALLLDMLALLLYQSFCLSHALCNRASIDPIHPTPILSDFSPIHGHAKCQMPNAKCESHWPSACARRSLLASMCISSLMSSQIATSLPCRSHLSPHSPHPWQNKTKQNKTYPDPLS